MDLENDVIGQPIANSFKLFAGPDFLADSDIPGTETDMFRKANEWDGVLRSITGPNAGGYHFHERLLTVLSKDQASAVVEVLHKNKVFVSIEAGGYLCNGTQSAERLLKTLGNYTAVGYINQLALESIFSRTIHGCEGEIKSFAMVSREAVSYARVLKNAMPHLEFGLIDAVPHFTAGPYAANSSKPLGDIRDALTILKKDMAAAGMPLQFYWADCPYEYSMAMTGNSGYEKLAFIANFTTNVLGIRMGKIFNSEQGGKMSNEEFHKRTMDDHHRYMSTVPASDTSDVIVESWYPYPRPNIPEETPNTFMYTAAAVFAASDKVNTDATHRRRHHEKERDVTREWEM